MIYSKSTRDLLWEFVSVKNIPKNQIIKKNDIISWFRDNYPKVKKGTIVDHIAKMSINKSSRLNWPINLDGKDDLFFQLPDGSLRLYDKEIDPTPIYKKGNVINGAKISEESKQKDDDEIVDETLNYWIFQGNPKFYNVIGALSDNALKTWSVKAFKNDIKKRDKVILWVTGKNEGCYALCEVDSAVYMGVDDEIEMKYYGSQFANEETSRVRIKITHNLAADPVLKSQIESIEELSKLKVGYQGTNFKARKEEYLTLLKLAENRNESFKKVLTFFDKVDLNNYFSFLIGITNRFSLNRGDSRLVFSVSNNNLNFTVGQRYCWNLYSLNAKGKYGVISSEKLLVDSKPYEGKSPQPYYNYYKELRFSEDDKKSIYTAIENELNRTSISSFRKFNNIDFENAVFDKTFSEGINNNYQMNFPLNTIFYGPPGTGKTYHTILRAAQIIQNRVITDYSEALRIFNENLGDCIEFITFHQNYSYEDFIQGLRPDVDNGTELSFERKDGVFKRIADRALKNLVDSEKPGDAKRDFDIVFNDFISPLNNGDIVELEVPMKKVSFYITSIGPKSIDFRKNEGDSKHTLSIATLRKMYEKGVNDIIIGGLQPYYNSILFVLSKKGKIDNNKIERKNYVIIIDEINRANISRVFGELITLIELDKRSHGKIPLKCTLPSGETFIVPSNLYIIGTMNTADKSIALLDIALRRRFEFEAFYPLYEIGGQNIYDKEILKKINDSIKKIKGHDFQIGHSYFMDDKMDLKNRMNKKVIPLLMEYFMNDEDEVKKILVSAGLSVEQDSWPLRING
jgi:hypothetical protein